MSDNQDKEVLKQIEREVRMLEGASKLLAACSRREQAPESSKSLLTCNACILALLSQLQSMRKAQILQRVSCRPSEDVLPCLGKVSLSDLRIPPMWKDSEYFKNKGGYLLLVCPWPEYILYINTQRPGEDVTYMLTTHTTEDVQRWSKAICQHVHNMSQWKQCCEHLMKIEMQLYRKAILVKQGSLYHEIGSVPQE